MKKTTLNTRITENGIAIAAQGLTVMFPVTDNEPAQSLGFQRWIKTSLNTRKALWPSYGYDSQAIINELQTRTIEELLNEI